MITLSVVSHSSPGYAVDDDSNPSDVVRNPPARPGNITNTAPAQGSKLARPVVGMRKAKKLANLEQSSALKQRETVTSTFMPGPTSSAAALPEDKTEMIGVTKELVAVKANTMLKQKDLQAQQERGTVDVDGGNVDVCWSKGEGTRSSR